ncbi:MAG TPA: hypothetical protein V6D10_20540 [Trichocoleus sp.]|jgi:hypothetical protein
MSEELAITTATSNAIVPTINNEILGRVFTSNGVHGLTAIERRMYYRWQCHRLGLDPYSFPFDYIETKDNRLVLFPNQRATDQLRKNRDLSVKVVDRQIVDGIVIATAACIELDGRETQADGTAELVDKYDKPLKGQLKAQAFEKADTRARRRATLAACGLSSEFQEESGRIMSAAIYDPPADVE